MKDFYIHYNYFTATTPFGLFFFIGCVLNLPFSCSFKASACVFFWTLAWFKKSFLLIRWYPFYLLLLLPWFLGWICDDWLLLGITSRLLFFSAKFSRRIVRIRWDSFLCFVSYWYLLLSASKIRGGENRVGVQFFFFFFFEVWKLKF